ncbi:MAG: LptF/LptG family permease [Bacteroidota bacterium]
MKRLYVFSIRSFAGPFVVTFCISMFMLIMQFLWKYIDDLMGKGIDFLIILELFTYVSASLIPLALPLAMLLSSIMTMGNLAENNELTALKSSGMSLFQILKPLTSVVLVISFCTFLFSNFVIPVANLKWHALIYDIQETKIATLLTPGTYSTVLDGYAIKIREGNDQSFKGITIHDHTDPSVVKTVRAESGEVFKSKNGAYLFFRLKKGRVVEELAPNAGQLSQAGHFLPTRRSSFEEATYKIDVSGFKINRTDEKLFKNEYEMWNVFQIDQALDSIQGDAMNIRRNFLKNVKMDHLYFQGKALEAKNKLPHAAIPDKVLEVKDMNKQELRIAYQNAASKIRRVNQNLDAQVEFMRAFKISLRQFEIEYHKKFALTFAIIVLFFVGAPLGAIVKKGGFGAPVVIAALLFMIYYVLTEIGLGLADSGVMSPFAGIWLATFVLGPIAFILMRSAAMDSRIFDKQTWKKLFNFSYR